MATCKPTLACVVLALVGIVPAQAHDPEANTPRWPAKDLPAHLAASTASEVAWAGHLVCRDRVRAAVPAVREALARWLGHDDLEGQLLRLHLLDALIQLDVRVPGEELLPHAFGALRVPALILAAKCPEANEAYFAARLDALAGNEDLEWRVCGNLLATLRDPRFVARCVRGIEFRIEVTVRDGRAPNRGVG